MNEEKNCFNCKWYPDNGITKSFDEVCHKCSNSNKWEQAAKWLKDLLKNSDLPMPQYEDALDMAIKALQTLEQIKQIINAPVYIQEDVMRYKMICEVMKDEVN